MENYFRMYCCYCQYYTWLPWDFFLCVIFYVRSIGRISLAPVLFTLSIIAKVTHVTLNPKKDVKMTKRFIYSLIDADTGEYLSSNYFPSNQSEQLVTLNANANGESLCRKWFDCFLRGIKQGRNLHLQLTIREPKIDATPKMIDGIEVF